MENKNNKVRDPEEKVELAKHIANQQKRVSKGYENLESVVFRFIRFMSSLIDRLFFNQRYTVWVAGLLALLLYVGVNYSGGENPLTQTITSAKVLNNVPVSTRYNDETFEISGVPSTCQVVLTGDAANVNNAATKTGTCQIDLEGYTEGVQYVPLVAVGYGNGVSATVTPSEAQITLKRKTTAQFSLEYDYINKNQMDSRYILSAPEFEGNNTTVNIRASQDTLNSISMVKALIDVKGQTTDFTIDAPLVAYNANGQVVNAEIDPTSVIVSVGVSSPHKTVPINLNLTNDAPAGTAIESVLMDHQTTVIYAPESVLANVNAVSVNLDASALFSDADTIVPVNLPSGVTSSDVTSVNLTVKLGLMVNRTIENVQIEYRNNNNSYGALNMETTSSVVVSGTENNVNKISADDLTVYIDVADLEPGTYDLPLMVEYPVNSYVKCTPSTSTIHITLVASD